MKKFLVILNWEFWRHLKSKSFLLATFVSPVIFAAIVLIPSFFWDTGSIHQPEVFGCIEFDEPRYCDLLAERLAQLSVNQQVILIKIHADTSSQLRRYLERLSRIKAERDSLEEAYNKIKERRRYIFQKPASATRERLLRQTYDELRATRESRDLAEIEFNRIKSATDSLLRLEVVQKADSMMRRQLIEGYLLIDPAELDRGSVEFHSILPSNFLRLSYLKDALQLILIEKRMLEDGISVSKINDWLQPFEIREFKLEAARQIELDFAVTYLGPIIVVLFLFISIFTSSGFLFNGIISEKSNRVIEILISSVKSWQLMSGKIFGLGLLGLFQIFIWMALTAGLIFLQVLNVDKISFLTLRNAGIFVLYFSLGYLFFASIFVGIGSVLSNEEDAHHLNQFMRILSIFPIALAVLVLQSPNSLIVRILSFIPFLTPTFIILRTPLGHPPQIDYLLSTGIMVVSIIVTVAMGAKIFRVGCLLYGKKPTFKEIWRLLWIK